MSLLQSSFNYLDINLKKVVYFNLEEKLRLKQKEKKKKYFREKVFISILSGHVKSHAQLKKVLSSCRLYLFFNLIWMIIFFVLMSPVFLNNLLK